MLNNLPCDYVIINIQELEVKMWNAAKSRDAEAFLEVVDENAVMVCGGFTCSGADYAEIIKEFENLKWESGNGMGEEIIDIRE